MFDSVQPHRQQPTRLPCPWDSPGKNTGVGCHFLLQCMKAKSENEVAQLCPTLPDPMVCSLPAYQRLATSLNKTQQQSDKSGSTDPKEQVNLNERSWNLWGPCVLVLSPASQPRREPELWPQPAAAAQDPDPLRPWDFPGKSTGVGCHCLRQQQFVCEYF